MFHDMKHFDKSLTVDGVLLLSNRICI